MKRGGLSIHGGSWYSYSTAIRQEINGIRIGNVTQYANNKGRPSRTTGRHQKLACVHSCNVLLDNVPEGTSDLIALAVQRGLIKVESEVMA